ncbi:hypothetical protein BY458DRAFT_536669 [Sporodiniella umbellata]|nr:hypothetical protein BY458DRAFT_536669 [Sporodiniella umbellata]
MSTIPSSSQVYEHANDALLTLTSLWETMLKIIRSVSTASGSSLTVEPNLVELQKSRKEFERLTKLLQTTTAWLEQHERPKKAPEQTNSADWQLLSKENEEAVKEADSVNEQLRQLLDKSYTLQLQMEMLHVSAQESSFK